jgi:hypothetical protein
MRNSGRIRIRVLLAAALAVSATPAAIGAHDIPQSVVLRVFVKPEGNRLRMLIRVPLESMRDVLWPLRGPGYLVLSASDTLVPDAARQWLAHYVKVYEGNNLLTGETLVATRIRLPSDPSFASFESAVASVLGPPLPPETDIVRQQAMVDVLFEYPIQSAESKFSIDPEWAHLGVRTTTVLRFLPPGGAERAFQYSGNPGLIRLDPRWHQAALTFVKLGFHHILDGIDHLLFVLCLVIPFRRFLPLVAVVTSFTVAHSITLIASAMGLAPNALWFPPLIETLIALSILYMAFENIVGPKLQRRWIIAFVFGLVHGFGFSFILSESLQFAGGHLATSLLAFNVGVEIGQVLVVAMAIPLLNMLFKYAVAERMGTILLSALVAHTAWHWMIERGATLSLYDVQLPTFDAAFAAGAMRALMLLLIVIGAGWLLYGLVGKLGRPTGTPAAPQDSTTAGS